VGSFEALQRPPRKIPKRELTSPPVAVAAKWEIRFLLLQGSSE
jgi:hypothetical protein